MHKIPPFVKGAEGLINMIVETPRGSHNKFNWEPEVERFKLKRCLPAGTAFPLDFGFVPGTQAEDGDPTDVLLLSEWPAYPGCLVECRLIGILKGKQKDPDMEEFVRNDRLLAVPKVSRDFAHVKTIADFGEQRLQDIFHFFQYYHGLDGGEYKHVGTADAAEALQILKDTVV